MAIVEISCLEEFNEFVGFGGEAKTVWDSLDEAQRKRANELFNGTHWRNLKEVNDFMIDCVEAIHETED